MVRRTGGRAPGGQRNPAFRSAAGPGGSTWLARTHPGLKFDPDLGNRRQPDE